MPVRASSMRAKPHPNPSPPTCWPSAPGACWPTAWGGLDWAGLPFVVELLGIDDVEAFVHQLMTIKAWRPDDGDTPSTKDE